MMDMEGRHRAFRLSWLYRNVRLREAGCLLLPVRPARTVPRRFVRACTSVPAPLLHKQTVLPRMHCRLQLPAQFPACCPVPCAQSEPYHQMISAYFWALPADERALLGERVVPVMEWFMAEQLPGRTIRVDVRIAFIK